MKTRKGDLGKNGILVDKRIKKIHVKVRDKGILLYLDVVFRVHSHPPLDLRQCHIGPITVSRSKMLKLNDTTNDSQCYYQWKVKQISRCHLICVSIFENSSLRIFASLYIFYMYKFSTIDKIQSLFCKFSSFYFSILLFAK